MPNLPHHHLGRVDSTISACWELAERGELPPFWLTADEQVAGRGRGGRAWTSKPGNLYSTYLGPAPSTEQTGLLPFTVALAVYGAAQSVLPAKARPSLRLKWPNDVLHDGAKIAGILIERRDVGGQPLVAIGMGINVEHAPDIAGRQTTCLADLGSTASVGDVFASLRVELARQLTTLEREPASILPAWSAKAIGIGQQVEVNIGGEMARGTFDHLAADGALMLRLPSGAMRAVRAGDLFVSGQTTH